MLVVRVIGASWVALWDFLSRHFFRQFMPDAPQKPVRIGL